MRSLVSYGPTTVRILSVAPQTARNQPITLTAENIGLTGRYRLRAFRNVPAVQFCGGDSAPINTRNAITSAIYGCDSDPITVMTLESMDDTDTAWVRTACWVNGTAIMTCPDTLKPER